MNRTQETLEITWDVTSGPDGEDETAESDRGRWPVWTKVVKELSIVMDGN